MNTYKKMRVDKHTPEEIVALFPETAEFARVLDGYAQTINLGQDEDSTTDESK